MKYLSEKIVLKLLNLEKIDRSIVISDPSQKDCPMVYISKEFSKHTGYSVKESLGKNCRFLQGPETDEKYIQQIKILSMSISTYSYFLIFRYFNMNTIFLFFHFFSK